MRWVLLIYYKRGGCGDGSYSHFSPKCTRIQIRRHHGLLSIQLVCKERFGWNSSRLTMNPRPSGPQEVLVAGSFNDWKAPTKLSKTNDGSFSETLALPFSKIYFKVRITFNPPSPPPH
jgi:hypothetical protein